MKATRYLLTAFFLLLGTAMYGQSKGKGTTQWVKVRDDQMESTTTRIFRKTDAGTMWCG